MLAATVFTALYLGGQTQDRFLNIDASWRTFTEEAQHRAELLSRMRAHLGYGGVIHNFKNYVLRKGAGYLDRLEQELASFEGTIAEYRRTGASEVELRQLSTIERTIAEYKSNITTAKRAAAEDWPPTRTDALVKVDDTQAIQAILVLDRYLQDKRRGAARSIAKAVAEGNDLVEVGFFFLAGLAVVALTLYALFYLLLRELQQTVSRLSDELSERRAAELVAKKFQRAVDQSPATIIITDTDGKIEYVNDKFCDLTGYMSHEVLGRSPKFLQSGHTPPDAYRGLSEQLRRGVRWQGTFRNLKKDGSTYWAKTNILPLRDDGREITHFIGLGEDITEHKKATDHIQRAQKMEAVGLLASGVAHDFNNVLTTILGNVHLARLDAPKEGEFDEELEQIEIAAKRARDLVGRVLAFARRQPGEAVSVRAGELISEVSRLIRASIPPNVELVCEVEDDDLCVHADPTKLHQILMNLCSNAAEAIGASGGRIIITAECDAADSDGGPWVCFTVSDNGPGIPESIANDVFTPFFTTKRAGKGTGLGLSVVASLVAEMGGHVTLDNKPDNGCCFKILMPQAPSTSQQVPQEDEIAAGEGEILLIDDEPEVMETCAKILRRLNYTVETYTDPGAAIAAFERVPERFDLIVTDFVMPEISGEDVCIKVRELRPDCPIILYSAYQPGGLAFQRFEPIRFMEKPFEPAALATTVKSLLRPEMRPSHPD